MNIVALSDIDFEDVTSLASRIDGLKPDILIFAGDGINTLYSLFFSGLMNNISPQQCLFVAGNNDSLTSKNNLRELGAVDIHENTFELGEIVFCGHEGMIVQNAQTKKQAITSHVHTEREAKSKLINSLRDDQKTVLVSHTPPYGIFDYTLSGKNVGSKSIRKASKSNFVTLCIFGHAHFSGGNEKIINNTLFANVASYEGQVGNCARLALIIINKSTTHIEWHEVITSNIKQLYTIQKIAKSKTESECLFHLNESDVWEDKHTTWSCAAADHTQRSEDITKEIKNPVQLVSQLYNDTITREAVYRLDSYYANTHFREYILKEFQPWPKFLGPMCLLELYENRISIKDPTHWPKALEVLPNRLKPNFRKYTRLKIAENHKKPIISSSIRSRLQKPNLVFIKSSYAPNSTDFLTIACASLNNTFSKANYIWLDRPESNEHVKSFLTSHFGDNYMLVHYAGNEKQFASSSKRINLYNEIKKSIYYPFKNFKLQTVSLTMAKLLREDLGMNETFLLQDHQKILLSTANYIHDQPTNSASFQTLKNTCKADIELLHYTFTAILRLERHHNTITFTTQNGVDKLIDKNGNLISHLDINHEPV